MHKITSSVNYTWNVRRKVSYAKRATDYFTMLLLGPVLMFSVAGVSAGILKLPIVQSLLKVDLIGQAYQILLQWIPFGMMVFVLAFLYWFLPDRRVKWYVALIGAIIGGGLWKITGGLFSGFVAGSIKYAAIYSAFASVLLFIIWLYVGWLIFLIGSRFAFYVQYPVAVCHSRHHDSDTLNLGIGLQLVHEILTAFYHGQGAVNLQQLPIDTDKSRQQAELCLNRLVAAGFVVQVGDEKSGYMFSQAPETISLRQIVQILQGNPMQLDLPSQVTGLSKRIEALLDTELKGITLKQWFDGV